MNPRRALMPPSPLPALCMLPSAFPVSRVDQALVARGLCDSREKAKRAIMAGQVRINQQVVQKPSEKAKDTDQLTVSVPEKYVSRGGFKLEHGLRHFQLDVQGLTTIDFGAS